MLYTKTIKVPVYWDTTKEKMDKLNKLSQRLSYCIYLISEQMTDKTKLNRKVIRQLTKKAKIKQLTGLSAGYIDQCVDKALWLWKSYRRLHRKWKWKVKHAKKDTKWCAKLIKREPSKPFSKRQHKVSPRIDYRTGKVEWNNHSKITPLWVKLSTLKLRETVLIPLNPARYHLEQLKNADINDFEIIKRNGKYYAHISVTKQVHAQTVKFSRGIDLGINKSIATVLLSENPIEEFILDEAKQKLLTKYYRIIEQLQRAEKKHKLKQMKHKRQNIAIQQDWIIANKVARISDNCIVAIGRTDYKRRMFKGDGNKHLRKKVHKWSYNRITNMIQLKCAERGISTQIVNEDWTSKTCHICGFTNTIRPQQDVIICAVCGYIGNADINASYNTAYKICQDDRLKDAMKWMENSLKHQEGSPLDLLVGVSQTV